MSQGAEFVLKAKRSDTVAFYETLFSTPISPFCVLYHYEGLCKEFFSKNPRLLGT